MKKKKGSNSIEIHDFHDTPNTRISKNGCILEYIQKHPWTKFVSFYLTPDSNQQTSSNDNPTLHKNKQNQNQIGKINLKETHGLEKPEEEKRKWVFFFF